MRVPGRRRLVREHADVESAEFKAMLAFAAASERGLTRRVKTVGPTWTVQKKKGR